MRKLISIPIICFLIFTSISSQAQIEKVFVKTFSLEGKSMLTLNVTGNVEVIHNNTNDMARIQLMVNLPHNTENVLKACTETGRYLMRLDYDVKEIIATSPALQFGVKIGNNFIEENVSYVVNVPAGVEVNIAPKAPAKAIAKLK